MPTAMSTARRSRCVKIVATSSSTPVAPIVAVAVTVFGAPRMSQANEIG
jgi:hypothetical protein